jgi:hypothetical protein
MANPNIVNVTDIKGNNALVALSTTNATAIVNNAAGSNKVYKINSLVVANVDGSTGCDVTVSVYSEDDIGGTAYPIVSTLNIPADSSVIVIDKNSGIYLKEDQSIGANAAFANDMFVTASWEEIK